MIVVSEPLKLHSILSLSVTKRIDDDRMHYDPSLQQPHRPTLAVDFDGTVAETNADYDLEKTDPREGAKEALETFRNAGIRIIIWTGRDDLKDVEDWLDKYDIPFDFVNHDNPDWPTGSRKIRADLYLDDRGVDSRGKWSGVVDEVFSRLGKKSYQRTKHVIITGPSGVGKSTLARMLSKSTGLPQWKLDNDDLWTSSDDVVDHPQRYQEGSKASQKFRKLLRKMVRKALRKDKPHILEGCQFLSSPSLLKGHKVIVVDADEDTVVRQRLQRDLTTGKLTPLNRPEREAKARYLYTKLRPAVDVMKSLPDVEVVNPPDMIKWVKGFALNKSYGGTNGSSTFPATIKQVVSGVVKRTRVLCYKALPTLQDEARRAVLYDRPVNHLSNIDKPAQQPQREETEIQSTLRTDHQK